MTAQHLAQERDVSSNYVHIQCTLTSASNSPNCIKLVEFSPSICPHIPPFPPYFPLFPPSPDIAEKSKIQIIPAPDAHKHAPKVPSKTPNPKPSPISGDDVLRAKARERALRGEDSGDVWGGNFWETPAEKLDEIIRERKNKLKLNPPKILENLGLKRHGISTQNKSPKLHRNTPEKPPEMVPENLPGNPPEAPPPAIPPELFSNLSEILSLIPPEIQHSKHESPPAAPPTSANILMNPPEIPPEAPPTAPTLPPPPPTSPPRLPVKYMEWYTPPGTKTNLHVLFSLLKCFVLFPEIFTGEVAVARGESSQEKSTMVLESSPNVKESQSPPKSPPEVDQGDDEVDEDSIPQISVGEISPPGIQDGILGQILRNLNPGPGPSVAGESQWQRDSWQQGSGQLLSSHSAEMYSYSGGQLGYPLVDQKHISVGHNYSHSSIQSRHWEQYNMQVHHQHVPYNHSNVLPSNSQGPTSGQRFGSLPPFQGSGPNHWPQNRY